MGQTRARELIQELNGLGWGEMTQPKELPPRRRPFALDNAAFLAFKANKPWDEGAFVRGVELCKGKRLKPDFVVCPDIVAGGWKSLEHSLAWLPRLKGFAPVYLAVQDGMTLDGVAQCLSYFDGVFVGGTGGWKLASCWWWAQLAHANGLPCHVGRISGRERVALVKAWGADSIDSCVPLWSESNRRAVLLGLADPPPDVEPPEPEQFLTGWEAL